MKRKPMVIRLHKIKKTLINIPLNLVIAGQLLKALLQKPVTLGTTCISPGQTSQCKFST